MPSDLHDHVISAEEAIYHDDADPLVSWQAQDLEQALQEAGFANVSVQRERHTEQRRLTDRHLRRWFQEEPLEDGRPTYRAHLRQAGLADGDIEQVARLYQKQLRDQTVSWHSMNLFVVAAK